MSLHENAISHAVAALPEHRRLPLQGRPMPVVFCSSASSALTERRYSKLTHCPAGELLRSNLGVGV